MGGGYISCGDFWGDDKSGSAISGVFETLPECVPESERLVFIETVLDPLAEKRAVEASEKSRWPIKVTTRQELEAGIVEASALLRELAVDLARTTRPMNVMRWSPRMPHNKAVNTK